MIVYVVRFCCLSLLLSFILALVYTIEFYLQLCMFRSSIGSVF